MFSSSSATGLLALASVLTAVNGHMIMKTPTPYGQSTLDNSPLVADGSDFPCKQRTGVYDMPSAGATSMAIGAAQTLSFTGSAVHGGGSCQLSLTTDKTPSKSTQWQVIHSIEGGCPASTAGNLGDNDATTFQYSIPEGIAAGDYTLAWTWFNKIGNREMYMNCAPITVTAAKKKRYAPSPKIEAKRDTSFPNMVVANLAGINTCSTKETFDYTFANPGASVQKAGTGPYTGIVGEPNCAPGGSSDASSGSSGSSSGSASSAASAPASSAASSAASAPATSAASSPVTQSSAGSFASASAPAASASAESSAAPSAASAAPVASSAAASAASSAAVPASTGSGSASSGNATQGASCSTEGQTVCATSGQSYMECASGYWQTMPVAAGTKCTGSVSDSIDIIAASKRHVRQHIRRHI